MGVGGGCPLAYEYVDRRVRGLVFIAKDDYAIYLQPTFPRKKCEVKRFTRNETGGMLPSRMRKVINISINCAAFSDR